MILLKRNATLLLMLLTGGLLFAQQRLVKGNIVAKSDKLPVIGASIREVGTNNGTISDLDGNFQIPVREGATLVVSYVGFKTLNVKASSQLNLQMEEDSKVMDELVVVGYTSERKADIIGAISVVSVEDMMKVPENNAMKALQGKVPGMTIETDGNPSGASKVRIRGFASLHGNTTPLYIIDGVPTQSGMHELNSNDIESIQVLKDAASASIYGSRAANGVIVITTKTGKKGKLNINFDASLSASMYHTQLNVLNTEEYGRVQWQAAVNGGLNPNAAPIGGFLYDWGYDGQGTPRLYGMKLPKYLDEGQTLPTSDTRWFDQVTQPGMIQSYNLSMNNGTDKGAYFFSLGYFQNDGLVKHSDFSRLSARVNSSFNLIDNMLTVGENLSINYTTETKAADNTLKDALQALPLIPVRTTDGKGWGGPVGLMKDRPNPYRILYDNRDNGYQYWRLFGNVYANLQPIKNLNIRTSFGLDYSNIYRKEKTRTFTSGMLSNDVARLALSQGQYLKWTWTNTATYNLQIDRHRADFLLGMEAFREDNVDFSTVREGYVIETDEFMWPDTGSGKYTGSGIGSGYTLLSFFGKANYSFDDRYLFSFTLRRDGSSRFGKNNRYGTFPSLSAGWRITEEAFMQSTRNILSDLKLRMGWGQTGNQNIDNLARYRLYSVDYGTGNPLDGIQRGTAYDINGLGTGILPSGFKLTQQQNDDIKWETTTQTNVGLDFSLLNQTLYGTIEYFYKYTTDLLIRPAYIAVIGEGGDRWINGASMENKGFEFSLGYRNKTSFGLTYDINGNLSNYQNRITYVPKSLEYNSAYGGNGLGNVIGQPIYFMYGYVADGIFRSRQEVEAHAQQTGKDVGRIRYKDLDNNGIVDEKDQEVIGNPHPNFVYGLNFNFEYRNFDLSIFFQGVGKVDIFNGIKHQTDFWSVSETGSNKGSRLLNAWSPENPDSSIPALTHTDTNNEARYSSYYIENGSYLKLKNLQLGYSLPQELIKRIKVEKLRFYISGQNLLTFKSKNFTGVDPEGANIGVNPKGTNLGYPNPMNLTVGVNIGF